MTRIALAGVAGMLCLVMAGAHAGEVQVAVAANFTAPFEKIAADFAADTGHKVVAAFGSTGRFYAQVKNGAPFEVLLAADGEIPRKLMAEGDAVAGSAFTYARGRLVLWAAKAGVVDDGGAVLSRGDLGKVAIANAKLAPYGLAAEEALRALRLYEAVSPRFVIGESITQAYQFVATGNATLGFVALSQVTTPGKPAAGSWWLVPANLHRPILQDAVLMKKGEKNEAATALLQYLRGEKARAVIRAFGYEL